MMSTVRLTVAVWATFAASTMANAGCHSRPSGEVTDSYLTALESRTRSAGVTSIDMFANEGGKSRYLLTGSNVELDIQERDGMPLEIRTILTPPYTSKDIDQDLTIASFTVGRMASESENAIKDEMYSHMPKEGDRPWLRKWGSTAIVLQKAANNGLVFETSKLDCD